MALVLADRVKETTTTTGTGTVTLAGASAGYRSFATVGNGNTTYYTISGQTTSEWEVGIGTYTTVGTTLSRTTVLSSSNGGSLVVFSAGTKDVFVTYPAGRSVNVDAANTGVSVPQLSATSIINSGLTSGRVVYSTTSGLETDSANLTFNGTILTSTGFAGPINGTVGATTPSTGAFTTLSATGVTTVQAGTALLPAIVSTTGTADTGIWFPAADTVAVSTAGTERMRISSAGNVGIGVTPSAWSLIKPVQVVNAALGAYSNNLYLTANTFFDGSGYRYIATDYASRYEQSSGQHSWASAPSGTAGTAVTFTERMRIDSIGNVGIGTSSPLYKLNVVGADATLVALISGATNGIRILPQTTSVEIAATDKTGTASYQKLDLNGSSLAFLISGTTRMTLNSSGDLGIGTSSPGARLDVQNSNAYGRIKSTSGTYALFDIDSPASMQPIIRFLSNGVEQSRILAPANEGASQLVFATGTSGTERMRIDASGNVMVGTTASTGSAANTASVVGGIFTTASGTVSAATATATTIFTCPTLVTGLYLVNAQLGSNDPATYGAVSLVGVGNTTLRATSLATGTNITITVSGQTIRSTQTSGLTQTITWTVTRLS